MKEFFCVGLHPKMLVHELQVLSKILELRNINLWLQGYLRILP